MNKLDKWAMGRPLGLVMIAQQLSIGTGPCFEFLKSVKVRERVEGYLSLPRLKEWFDLYRRHSGYKDGVARVSEGLAGYQYHLNRNGQTENFRQMGVRHK